MRNNLICLTLFYFTIAHGLAAQLKVDPTNDYVKIGDIGVAPTATLHISGEANGKFPLRVTSSHNQKLFEVQQGGVGAGNFFIYDSNGNKTIQFAGESTFYISTPGNVGIDQINPTYDFEIGTENGGGGNAYKPTGGMWMSPIPLVSNNGSSAFTQGLRELLQMKTIRYSIGASPEAMTLVGVSAQDLKKIAPEMIVARKYTQNLEEDNLRSENGAVEKYQTINPSNFLYMLINAVQELNQNLNVEKNKNTVLEEQLNSLNSRLEKLEQSIKKTKHE